MTAIRASDSALREKIDNDGYNQLLNTINAKYTEMEKYINNLNSDITSIKEFEKDIFNDMERGYDVGTSLETLSFQRISLQIDLEFFVHMKEVYIKKLYGDLYSYCDQIIENALAIEELPDNVVKKDAKKRKFRGMKEYPPPPIPNPNAFNEEGRVEGEPEFIPDTNPPKYDMNEVFSLINCVTSNLRELADDIGTFAGKIQTAQDREARGFSVGNLIMNLQGQQQKLTIEFDSSIMRLAKFLEQNSKFSERCLRRIKLISEEITTAEEEEEDAEQ